MRPFAIAAKPVVEIFFEVVHAPNRAGVLDTTHLYSSSDEKMMRRQVKPFVTEYRGTPRRANHPAAGDPHQDGQASRSRSYAEAEKIFQPESADDSYEAALRAADALFAIERTSPDGEGGVPADASLFRVPGVLPDEASLENAVASPGEVRQVEVTPRRILQAIEPPTEDRFAALEAERAPKRRGRKPGSKNKPKTEVSDDWEAAKPMAIPAARPSGRTIAASPISKAPRFAFPDDVAEADEVSTADSVPNTKVGQPASAALGVDDALPPPRGRTDKFGWKRNGLRPGERWKRRLPKAAR